MCTPGNRTNVLFYVQPITIIFPANVYKETSCVIRGFSINNNGLVNHALVKCILKSVAFVHLNLFLLSLLTFL